MKKFVATVKWHLILKILMQNQLNIMPIVWKMLAIIFQQNIMLFPIPPPGESVNVWEEETKEYTKKVADGKSAEGYGSWKHLINNRQSKEDFESRFKDKPNCNIAIISGKVSQAFSIDIDGEEGRKYFYDKIGESG